MRRESTLLACLLCAALLPSVGAASEEGRVEGEVELLYRAVEVNGEQRKYDEDFDGMTDGMRIGSFAASWAQSGEGWLDHARVSFTGLGGDPYERTRFALGKKDRWQLSLDSFKQDSLYNLFELVNDEDGATWDAERRFSDLRFAFWPKDKLKLVLEYGRGDRSGASVFMKDISRDLFRLETPLDQTYERLTVGAEMAFGRLDLIVRHQLRTTDNDFNNTTEGDLGLDVSNNTQLNSYDWAQHDRNATDWTTVLVRTPIGSRVNLTASVSGTLLGEEDLRSSVDLTALGIDFAGNEFGGTCAIGGAPCASDATCDAINAGDVCVPLVGTSSAMLAGDTTLIDLDASVRLASNLQAGLRYQSYSRDLAGTLDRDLDGDGTFEDLDGDTVPGSTTSIDQQFDTITALLDYRPMRRLDVRAGYRTVDRELTRSGFGMERDLDFESDGDGTLLFGVGARPTDWLRLNADYEDAEIDMAFAGTSLYERSQTRVRAVVTPTQRTRLNLTFRDWENENVSANFRPVPPSIDNDSRIDGTTWSVAWTNSTGENLDYTLRYTDQDVDNTTGVLFDTAGFGGTAPGLSTFLADHQQYGLDIRYRMDEWVFTLGYTGVEAEGTQDLVDLTVPATPSLVNRETVDQSFYDATIAVDYSFPSGIRLGAAIRDFDYDDGNDLLDYDGRHFTVRAGFRF